MVGPGMIGAEIALRPGMFRHDFTMKEATLELAEKGKDRSDGTLDNIFCLAH